VDCVVDNDTIRATREVVTRVACQIQAAKSRLYPNHAERHARSQFNWAESKPKIQSMHITKVLAHPGREARSPTDGLGGDRWECARDMIRQNADRGLNGAQNSSKN
jgi:hypothetical protein